MDKFIDGHWPHIPDGCLTVGLRASLRLLYRAVRVLKPKWALWKEPANLVTLLLHDNPDCFYLGWVEIGFRFFGEFLTCFDYSDVAG